MHYLLLDAPRRELDHPRPDSNFLQKWDIFFKIPPINSHLDKLMTVSIPAASSEKG